MNRFDESTSPVIENMKKLIPAKNLPRDSSPSVYPTVKTCIRNPTKHTTNSMLAAAGSKSSPVLKEKFPSLKSSKDDL